MSTTTFWLAQLQSIKDEKSLDTLLGAIDNSVVVSVQAGLLKDLLCELTSLRETNTNDDF